MVIVTLPPWETRRALGLLHRDIQSYSLLHIMELSSQRANGSDPFNLCQKHTDEEVSNARPLPWGRHSPPPPLLPLAAPFLLLDSLTGAPHLSSFTAQSGETGRLASRRPLHMPRPAHKDTGCPTKQLQLLEEPARPRREGVVGGGPDTYCNSWSIPWASGMLALQPPQLIRPRISVKRRKKHPTIMRRFGYRPVLMMPVVWDCSF